eukprot:gene14360-15887_t
MANQEDPLFKIERFDVFLSALVRIVEEKFRKIVRSFDDWFGEFIVGLYDISLLKSVYYSSTDTVRCTLYWSNPDELHGYPNLILDNFYRCLSGNMLVGSLASTSDVRGLKENCKTTRLIYFEEVKKVKDVKEAVAAFARKVLKEMPPIRRK